ncbi:hypothetical protein RA8CHR_00733 [Variovorax sp. RA8]|nr:hypothetical protein RA8CHR_00733 [Variovorax sp. RA8]
MTGLRCAPAAGARKLGVCWASRCRRASIRRSSGCCSCSRCRMAPSCSGTSAARRCKPRRRPPLKFPTCHGRRPRRRARRQRCRLCSPQRRRPNPAANPIDRRCRRRALPSRQRPLRLVHRKMPRLLRPSRRLRCHRRSTRRWRHRPTILQRRSPKRQRQRRRCRRRCRCRGLRLSKRPGLPQPRGRTNFAGKSRLQGLPSVRILRSPHEPPSPQSSPSRPGSPSPRPKATRAAARHPRRPRRRSLRRERALRTHGRDQSLARSPRPPCPGLRRLRATATATTRSAKPSA